MPKKSYITVKEEHKFLSEEYSKMDEKNKNHRDKILMLLLVKDMENGFFISRVSKEIKSLTGICRDRGTITNWLNKYNKGGYKELLRTNYKTRSNMVLTPEVKNEIFNYIFNSKSTFYSVTEILDIINFRIDPEIKESTFRKYVKTLITAQGFKELMEKKKNKTKSIGINDDLSRIAKNLCKDLIKKLEKT